MQLDQETIITEQREEIAKLKKDLQEYKRISGELHRVEIRELKAEIKELKKKYLKEILHSCEMYKEYVDPEFTWENFTIEEQNQILKSKRSNNLLDTTCLEQLFPEIKNIKDSLKFIFTIYNK